MPEEVPASEVEMKSVAIAAVMVQCCRCHQPVKGSIERNQIVGDPEAEVVGSTGFIWLGETTKQFFKPSEVVLCIPCLKGRAPKTDIVIPGSL